MSKVLPLLISKEFANCFLLQHGMFEQLNNIVPASVLSAGEYKPSLFLTFRL